jgi:hypothetical protein
MSENLERARFFHGKIGEILLREWDPNRRARHPRSSGRIQRLRFLHLQTAGFWET